MAHLTGSLEAIPLPRLLDLLVQVGASGWLTVGTGQVYIEAGQVKLALCGARRGRAALEALALAPDGQFEFFGKAEVRSPEPNLAVDSQELLASLDQLARCRARLNGARHPGGPSLNGARHPDGASSNGARHPDGASSNGALHPPGAVARVTPDRALTQLWSTLEPLAPGRALIPPSPSPESLTPVVESCAQVDQPAWGEPHVQASYGLALIGVALAELMTASGRAELGVVVDAALVFALVAYASFGRADAMPLSLALISVPLVRMVALTVPRFGLPTSDGYLVASLPLVAAALTLARVLGLSREALGLRLGNLRAQLAVGLLGLPVALATYDLTHPPPLVEPPLSWHAVGWPALTLAGAGLIEEVVFRGVLQAVAYARLGWRGLALVSALDGLLQVGSQPALAAALVFVVGFAFAGLVARTRSLLGVALAHGLANIGLMLILPAVVKR